MPKGVYLRRPGSRPSCTRESGLWPRVAKSAGCWEFNGPRHGKGYGRYRVSGKYVWAHHVSYELTYGPIPNGLFVLHHCDNPPCVRPDHLFLGTIRDNAEDMVRKGRQFSERRREAQPRGEAHGSAKLTAAQVIEIRRQATANIRHGVLAAQYGVARRTISEIAQGKRWRSIQEPE
jgi:hypothetical protein